MKHVYNGKRKDCAKVFLHWNINIEYIMCNTTSGLKLLTYFTNEYIWSNINVCVVHAYNTTHTYTHTHAYTHTLMDAKYKYSNTYTTKREPQSFFIWRYSIVPFPV